jgi:deferrochelatase/peroxidase EfeB
MSQVQSGILPEHCRAAIWIEANVTGDKRALREGCRVFIDKLATLQANSRMRPSARLWPLGMIPGAS